MKILNICSNLTGSVVKHVQLQKMAGAETRTAYRKCGIPMFAARRVGNMFTAANVGTIMDFVAWCDVVVVHSSLDSVNILKIDSQGKPIIWACHDYIHQSKEVAEHVAAVMVPSYGYKDQCFAGFSKPVHVIQRKVASVDWPTWPIDRINCTVLNGVVSDDPKKPYRDYSMAKALLNGKLIVLSAHFPSNMAHKYMTMELTEPDRMLQNMAMFETSWAGCGNDNITFDTIMNNKFFEGIAAGAVPITYRSKEMSEYAEKHKCGLIIHNSSKYAHIVRKNIADQKHKFTLESELPEFNKVLAHL